MRKTGRKVIVNDVFGITTDKNIKLQLWRPGDWKWSVCESIVCISVWYRTCHSQFGTKPATVSLVQNLETYSRSLTISKDI